jgi:hypothetical protein
MNTEEINLMMQLVEKIQNNNTNDGLLNPHQLNQVEEFLKEHLSFVDWDGLDKSEVMLGKKMEELYSLKDDSRRQRAEKAREEILNKISAFENKVKDKIQKITYAVQNVPRIKPVDTFNNSDVHREMVKLLEDLKTTMYRHSDQLRTIEEWIKATGHVEKARLREEIASEDKDVDLREVSLEDVIEPPDPHIKNDWCKKLVRKEINLDTRTQNLMRTLDIDTLEELMCFTQKELMNNFNFGGCSMAKLNKDLKGLGLSLSKGA